MMRELSTLAPHSLGSDRGFFVKGHMSEEDWPQQERRQYPDPLGHIMHDLDDMKKQQRLQGQQIKCIRESVDKYLPMLQEQKASRDLWRKIKQGIWIGGVVAFFVSAATFIGNATVEALVKAARKISGE